MIVSDALQYVFVSVPKCGTQTMYSVLTSRFRGHRIGGEHHNRVPPHATGYFTFSILRNPYDRMVSLWWSVTQRPERRADDRYRFRAASRDPDNFETWCEDVLTPGAKVADPVGHLVRACDQLGDVRVDELLHIHRLENQFRLLPFVRDPEYHLPVINPTRTAREAWEVVKSHGLGARGQPTPLDIGPRKPFTAYLTDRSMEIIADRYRGDFEMGGYEP